jgi:hypothetical protein
MGTAATRRKRGAFGWPLRGRRRWSLSSVVAPVEIGVKRVAVAQHVERIGITRLPPALYLTVAQVRRAVHGWITPLPAGVLMAELPVSRVTRTNMALYWQSRGDCG